MNRRLWFLSSIGGRVATWRRDRASLLRVRASLCNLYDTVGAPIFTPHLLPLFARADRRRVFDEWIAKLLETGSTHVTVAPWCKYNPSPFPLVDWRNYPYLFGAFLAELLNRGLTPIVMLSEGNEDQRDNPTEEFLYGVQEFAPFCLWVPSGWEPSWRSRFTSEAIYRCRRILGSQALLGFHARPDRANGASFLGTIPERAPVPAGALCREIVTDEKGLRWQYLIESDDPWRGDEIGFWETHGGEELAFFLFQTVHGRDVTQGFCRVGDESCWLTRWDEVVARLGAGWRGWRQVEALVLFETVAKDIYDRTCDVETATIVARAGDAIAAKYGVTIGFGNGMP